MLSPDDRGVFLESFKASVFEETIGHPLDLQQMNISVSTAGTVRGVHFADVPPGQAKYVQCFSGRILDVVVDIRVGSPTFGQWDAVELSSDTRNALYLAEGLGHAFCALTESATVGYFCSEPFSPCTRARHPPDGRRTCAAVATSMELLLSPKDAAAPTLAEALEQGLLPDYAECMGFIEQLRA